LLAGLVCGSQFPEFGGRLACNHGSAIPHVAIGVPESPRVAPGGTGPPVRGEELEAVRDAPRPPAAHDLARHLDAAQHRLAIAGLVDVARSHVPRLSILHHLPAVQDREHSTGAEFRQGLRAEDANRGEAAREAGLARI
jgi:hypothetical protein